MKFKISENVSLLAGFEQRKVFEDGENGDVFLGTAIKAHDGLVKLYMPEHTPRPDRQTKPDSYEFVFEGEKPLTDSELTELFAFLDAQTA